MSFTLAPNSTLSVFSGQAAVQSAANVATTVSTSGAAPSAGSHGTVNFSLTPTGPISLSRK